MRSWSVSVIIGLVAGAGGCGLSKCEELCTAKADCLENEIATYETSWGDWTGYVDRGAYEQACFAEFEQSREQGAPRGDLERTCRNELAAGACAGGG